MKKALITGSAGLVGSEAVKRFAEEGFLIIGIDNDMRRFFFGEEASTKITRVALEDTYKDKYIHVPVDVSNNEKVEEAFKRYSPFDVIIHSAGQPSHDWSAGDPVTDFEINARGTLVILENYRRYSPQAAFVFTSTNKVYGDAPNKLSLIEFEKRYDVAENSAHLNGIDENFGIDFSLRTPFGVSKTSADLMVQEYGKYFGLPTGVFRASCITGPTHRGVQLHGFLAYLVRCAATEKKYTIFGYKGKQVRDHIHAGDLAHMFWNFYLHPRNGEVYNVGGGRTSSLSVLESIEKIENVLGKKVVFEYTDKNRIGDHIWYISDISKFRTHYPNWDFTYTIDDIIREIGNVYT